MEQAGIPRNGTVGISQFTLENAAAQLAPWFSQIELRDYKNGLRRYRGRTAYRILFSQP